VETAPLTETVVAVVVLVQELPQGQVVLVLSLEEGEEEELHP
jgi:hypothetical protein